MGSCCSKEAEEAQHDNFGADDDDVHQPAKQPRLSEWNLTALTIEDAAQGTKGGGSCLYIFSSSTSFPFSYSLTQSIL